jgi:N utilization substance protein A
MANALSPAKVIGVKIDKEKQAATVVIPDKQLSLAIGKEGQNVRLAVKLTGLRIDIRSASEAEKERAEATEEEVSATGDELAEVIEDVEPSLVSAQAILETTETVPSLETQKIAVKKEIRFAEEIVSPAPSKPQAKAKKRKKSARGKGAAEDGIRLKKKRREVESYEDGEEEY